MSILNNSIRSAVALALVGAAGTAHAIDAANYATNTNVNVYISGSTALDNTLLASAIQTNAGQTGVCQAGTIDYYQNTAATQVLIYCTGNTSSGVSGSNLAIFKESTAGSANGVQPLINVAKGGSSGVSFMNPAVALSCGTNTTVSASGNLGAYNKHTGCSNTAVSANVVPTGGFSDVEAAILRTPAGAVISAADATANLTPTPTLDQVWSVTVTTSLYRALQAKQGLNSGGCAPVSPVTVGSGQDTPACVPSLSRQQVAGLLSGQIYDFAQLGLSGTDTSVYVCRRDPGSGTEASFEAYFVGARCSSAAEAMVSEDGLYTWANASGGAMRTCLKTFELGGSLSSFSQTAGLPTFTGTAAGGQFAVGLLNTEIKATDLSATAGTPPGGVANAGSFRVIKVDGALPTIANVQNGYYPYFSTGNAYKIKSGKTGAPTGSSLTAFNAITNLIGHPLWTADNNASYNSVVWGVVGDVSPANLYLASNTPTLPATSAALAAKTSVPVNPYSKTASGSINNCDAPQLDTVDLSTVNTGWAPVNN